MVINYTFYFPKQAFELNTDQQIIMLLLYFIGAKENV